MPHFLLYPASNPTASPKPIPLVLPQNSQFAAVLRKSGSIVVGSLVPNSGAASVTATHRKLQHRIVKIGPEEESANVAEMSTRQRLPKPFDPEEHKQLVQRARERVLNGAEKTHIYCWLLMKHRLQDGQIRCKICGIQFRAMYSTRKRLLRPRYTHFEDHARKHLRKPTINCQHCDYKAPTASAAKHHLVSKHKITAYADHVKDSSREDIEEFVQIIDRCYGEVENVECFDDNLSVDEYCLRAVIDNNSNGRLICRACQSEIRVQPERYRTMQCPMAINHVLSHLNQALFICRLCEYRCQTKATISKHCRLMHNRLPDDDVVQDRTTEFSNQIKGLIDQCFGLRKGAEKSNYELPEEIRESLGRMKNKIVNNRCSELIKLHGEGSRITCLLCSKSIQARKATPPMTIIIRFMLDHSNEHFGKMLYQCKFCKIWKTGQQPMSMHVIHSHGGTSVDGYSDISHKYTDDILAMLNKCYDGAPTEVGVAKFGLEESDGEQEPSTSKESPAHKYSMRPRKPTKKPKTVDDTPVRGKRKIQTLEKGAKRQKREYEFLKLPFRRQASISMRLVVDDGIMYGCDHCSMVSKHKDLVSRHMKVMHM